MHAHYCNFTELLFCRDCFLPAQSRAIPWRVVHLLDMTALPVSRIAAQFLDVLEHAPVVVPSAVASSRLSGKPLRRLVRRREKLRAMAARMADHPLLDSVLSNDLGPKRMYLAADTEALALVDVPAAMKGQLATVVAEATETLAHL